MKKLVYSILIVAGLSLLGACGPNPQPGSERLLEQAEKLVEKYPDSAMLFIDSLFYPEKSLKHEPYMRYLVTQVQAKYKTFRPIDQDTLIFQARDFFSGNVKNPRMAALAWFYSGCVHRERKDYDNAMRHYSTARDYAVKTDDPDLQGLVKYNMGDLFAEKGLYKEAMEYYNEAEDFYLKSTEKPHEKQARCFSAIGRMYMLIHQPDSAFWYFHEGLDIAEAAGDNELQCLLSQNLSVSYTRIKQFDKAENYLRQSFSLNADSSEVPLYYLNFAKLYAGMGVTDSVTLYVNNLKKCLGNKKIGNLLKTSIFRFLADSEKENGNFKSAFDYLDMFTNMVEEITEERLHYSVYEIQRKYNYEMMKTSHERRVTVFQFWMIILLLTVIVIGTFFRVYALQQRKKHVYTQQKNEILKGIVVELKKPHEIIISNELQDLRELLLWKFSVIRKLALLDQYSKNEINSAEMLEIFKEIVFQGDKKSHWQSLLSVLDKMNEGISDKIKRLFPVLNKTEYKIVLLTYFGMSVREISFFIGLSQNTVQTYRTSIRKKLGISDVFEDTATHLKGIVDNP